MENTTSNFDVIVMGAAGTVLQLVVGGPVLPKSDVKMVRADAEPKMVLPHGQSGLPEAEPNIFALSFQIHPLFSIFG